MDKNISYFGSFFKILVQPRETLRSLIDHDPGFGKWVLLPVYCLLAGINPDVYVIFLRFLPSAGALVADLLLMMAIGIAFFWFSSILNFLFGKWLGGKGTLRDISTAYAWAYVPCFAALPVIQLVNIPKWMAIMGGVTDPGSIVNMGNSFSALAAVLLSFVFFLWSWVLIVFAVSEAHRISIGRAIGTVAIFFGLMILLGIVLGFVLVLGVLGSMPR